MSRAFVKEDASQEPLFVPQRAPLPEGEPNLVTSRGLRLLEEELAQLQERQRELDAAGDELPERSEQLHVVNEQLSDLEDRLATAKVVPVPDDPQLVQVGATVTTRDEGGREMSFRIVGVDEANPLEGLVSFVAPTAAALLGRRVGEQARAQTGRGEQTLEILAVSYETD